LIAEAGPTAEGYKCARHREFVVFDASRIIEEYIIGYIRDTAPELPNTVPQTLSNEDQSEDAAVEAEGGKRMCINPIAKAPTQLFPLGGIDIPAGIAISPCGKFAFVGNESEATNQNRVARIDLTTGKLTFPFALAGRPESIAIAPNGTFALVTNSENDLISYIDLQTPAEGAEASVAAVDTPNQVAISPCSSFALVACEDSKIARIDLSGPSLGAVTFPYEELDFKPQGIAIAPSGKYALLCHDSRSIAGVSSLDLASGSVADLHDDSRLQCCRHVAFAPSGSFAWVGASAYHARIDRRTEEISFAEFSYEEDGLEIKDALGVAIAPSENYALVTCAETDKVYCISNSAKSWKPLPTTDDDAAPPKTCCCAVM
jgi:DNA-binding beta-propeller fold protein YncE